MTERERLIEILRRTRRSGGPIGPEVRDENLRRLIRAAMPKAAVSDELQERVLRALAAAPERRAAQRRPRLAPSFRRSGQTVLGLTIGRIPRKFIPIVARAAVGAVLAAALMTFVPWNSSRTMAAEVAASVQRANTWHLHGWQLHHGRRIPWAIWGRQYPFLYREQTGDRIVFDDGKQRVQMFRSWTDGELFAVRMQSMQAPEDVSWSPLRLAEDWRGVRPCQQTRDTVLFRFHESSAQGPGAEADRYFTVDKRTWLPTSYEWRRNANGANRVAETLRAEYNVPLPASVSTLRLPPGIRLVDALGAASKGGRRVEGSQHARGLKAQVLPLTMDAEGTVLLRMRCWLGNVRLGSGSSPIYYGVDLPSWFFRGETQPEACQSDGGLSYIKVDLPLLTGLLNGDRLLLFTPLEPVPGGAPLPRTLTLNLSVSPQFMTRVSGASDEFGGSPLFAQDFNWTIALPVEVNRIDIDDYLPPGHRQRIIAEDVPLKAAAAAARADRYTREGNLQREVHWLEEAIAASKSGSSFAQFRRLDLAEKYRETQNPERAAQVLREVIDESKRHPDMAEYYRSRAEEALRSLPGS
jgi:hypothetical protein